MNEESQSKSRLDGDLQTATVMQCSVLDLQVAVVDLQEEVHLMRRINQSCIEALKAFGDLHLELIEWMDDRRSIEKTVLRIEREAARTRLPLWFWRPEEDLGTREQIERRARFLIDDMKYGPDDVWDLLREYLAEYARVDIPEEGLLGMLKHFYEEEDA